MCNRIAQFFDHAQIVRRFPGARLVNRLKLSKQYNIAPGKQVAVMTLGSPMAALNEEYVLQWNTWGFRRPPFVNSALTFTAAMEVIGKGTPNVLSGYKWRRCIVPVSGSYAWSRKGSCELPHFIQGGYDNLLLLAGLTTMVQSPQGGITPTVVLVTGPADERVEHVVGRTPVHLTEWAYLQWLHATKEEARKELETAYTYTLAAHRVTAYAVNPSHQGARCVERYVQSDRGFGWQPAFHSSGHSGLTPY